MKLKGKVALITGGGRGIGRAIAERYAAEGCRISLVARSPTELALAAEAIQKNSGTPILHMVADVGNEAEVRHAVQQTKRELGKIDILVNCAGVIGPVGPLAEIDGAAWTQAIQINLTGTFYAIKAVLPIMQRQRSGRIINFSGGGALLPAPFFDAYSVAKAGIVRLTENLALELKATGIFVSAIAPGGVNTKMFDDMLQAGEEKVGPEIWQSFLKRKAAGGDSLEEPAALAVYLATEDAAWANGRVISAKWDPWRTLAGHREEILQSDLYTMRRIVPKDRGLTW